MSEVGARVVEEARGWLGTPYQHQASLQGVGCDCLGLVRGVWRAVVGEEPQPVPAYRADWAESGASEQLLSAARRWFRPACLDELRQGDLLLFRMQEGVPVKHAALLSEAGSGGRPERMIHAYWGRAVVENALGPWWRARLAASFRFPGAD